MFIYLFLDIQHFITKTRKFVKRIGELSFLDVNTNIYYKYY